MAALQYVHVPGYAAMIFRRTFRDLAEPGAIMDRAKAWLQPQGVKWNGDEHRFTFHSGATLTFAHLEHEDDKYKKQGAELQFVAFDELTHFQETQYRYLLSRVRRVHTNSAPLRARAASNPGGVGHAWVKSRFIDGGSERRVFIPAKLSDNPSIDAAEYSQTLSELDPVTRKQLLDGIWVQDGSGLVYRQFDTLRNVIDAAPLGIKWRVMGIDYGVTDDCAWTVWGWRPHDPVLYGLLSMRASDMIAPDAADKTKEILAALPCCSIVGDQGGLGKGFIEEARRRHNLPILPADKLNKRGYIDLFNGDLARGRIKLVRGACEELATEWVELPWDAARMKEAPGADNHCSDSALYAWREATAYAARAPKAPEPPEASAAAFLRREAEELEGRERKARPFWYRG